MTSSVDQTTFQQLFSDNLEKELRLPQLPETIKNVAYAYGNILAASSNEPISIAERLHLAEEVVDYHGYRELEATTRQALLAKELTRRAFKRSLAVLVYV